MKSTERQELEHLGRVDQGRQQVPDGVWVNRAPFQTEFRLKVFGTYCSVAAGVALASPGKPNNL